MIECKSPPGAEAGDGCLSWKTLFDRAGVGIILLDRHCRFLDANRRWFDMFGYTAEELRSLEARMLAGEGRYAKPSDQFEALLRGEIDQYRTEKGYVRKDGTTFWGDLSVSVLRDGAGAPMYVLGFLIDISDHKRAEEKLQEANEQLEQQLSENQALQARLRDLAVRDSLTGLFNRRYMEETLKRELSRAARDRTALSLVMIDIDRFKTLNDTYGHQAGDRVLKELAALLQSQMRGEDIACRYGGEEFVAILPGASLRDAAQRAESWRRAFMALRIPYEEQLLGCTLSMGIAEYPRHGLTGSELLFQADSALYMAKRAGRNRVVL
jgi:diguanylate cyclase (GGDEF)-like protein/PAS domain S-box-containing protein